MSYYIKKTQKNKGLYLQIYYSHSVEGKKYPVSDCYKTLGYYDDLKLKLNEDPLEYFQKEIEKLNNKNKVDRAIKKIEKIDNNDIFNFGYFLVKNLFDDLKVQEDLENFNIIENLNFNFSNLLSDLIFARIIKPESKLKTFENVFPELINSDYKSNIKNLYNGLFLFGKYYDKIIEIFNFRINKLWKRNTNKTYFDGTNFYFEINKEDDFRKKGPSKENQRSPLVSMRLLLDRDLIPLNMKIFSGNQSEKPIFREVLKELKNKEQIKGKTIRIADKGLNCSENIINTILDNDGYIFSKSVKSSCEKDLELFNNIKEKIIFDNITGEILNTYKSIIVEKEYSYLNENNEKKTIKVREKRILTFSKKLYEKQNHDFEKMIDDISNISNSEINRENFGKKTKYLIINNDQKFDMKFDFENIEKDRKKLGYNLIITSEIEMDDEEIFKNYHELWHIEETFKMMKSSLDARPIFLQKKESIEGHFLIIYLSVLLLRLLEIKIFNNEIHYTKILETIRELKCRKIKNDTNYFNISKLTPTISNLSKKLNLELDNLFISTKQMNKIFKKALKNFNFF